MNFNIDYIKYPMLAKPGDVTILEDGMHEHYTFEEKLDGVRCMVYVTPGKVTLFSRTGKDISRFFPEVVAHLAARLSGVQLALIDGEIVADTFQKLQTRLQRESDIILSIASCPCSFVAFDVLHYNERSMLGIPWHNRRALLHEYMCLQHGLEISPLVDVQRAREIVNDAGLGIEGVMAKLKTSYYIPGYRTGDWRKLKPMQKAEVYIGGVTHGTGRRAEHFGSLLVGSLDSNGILSFGGAVGTGFTDDMLTLVISKLQEHARSDRASPFKNYPSNLPQLLAVKFFVDPVVRCTCTYQETTKDGIMRFPSFGGLID